MKGKVESISKKQGEKNGRKWVLNSITIDGETYSLFGKCPVEVGDFVEFEWKPDGKFKKIASIEKAPEPKLQANIAEDDRQLMIVRQSSLKAAIEILAHNLDINRVKAIAELLTQYVMEGISEDEFNALIDDYLQEHTEEKFKEELKDAKEDEEIPF